MNMDNEQLLLIQLYITRDKGEFGQADWIDLNVAKTEAYTGLTHAVVRRRKT